jgi:hypothetical protein
LPELRFAQTVRLRILEERPMRKPNLVAVAFASIPTAVVAGAIGVVVTPTEASAQMAPSAVANEVMMEDAAAGNVILGSMATPTSGQSLSYTSYGETSAWSLARRLRQTISHVN